MAQPNVLRSLDEAVVAPPSAAFIWTTTGAWFGGHLLIWLRFLRKGGYAIDPFFERWDSAYYAAIARDGADAAPRAFFPLFPQLVGAISRFVGTHRVSQVGAIVSAIAFAIFVAWIARACQRTDLPDGLAPRTRAGWLFFLFAPATYIFHSSHTEALFLLLSFGAMYLGATRRALGSGLFAAATTWTRYHGVLVSISSALLAATVAEDRRRALRDFLIIGAVSASAFGAFLLYQALTAGSPLAFIQAQGGWTHADSPLAVVRTLWFGNPWQSTNDANLYRYAFYWLLVAGAVLAFRQQPAIGVYALGSVAVVLLQGELVNAFRFGSVIFPAMFVLGDSLARRSRPLAVAVLLAFVALNVLTTRDYGAANWAY